MVKLQLTLPVRIMSILKFLIVSNVYSLLSCIRYLLTYLTHFFSPRSAIIEEELEPEAHSPSINGRTDNLDRVGWLHLFFEESWHRCWTVADRRSIKNFKFQNVFFKLRIFLFIFYLFFVDYFFFTGNRKRKCCNILYY